MYVDAILPFGLNSVPKIFRAVVDTLEWCIAAQGVKHVTHYLDDFAVMCPPDSEAYTKNLLNMYLYGGIIPRKLEVVLLVPCPAAP